MGSITSGIAGGATIAIVIKAIDDFSNSFNSATTGMEKLQKTAEVVGKAAALAFAGFTVSAVQAALAYKPIEDSFNKLTVDSEKFLFNLRTVTKETISDFDLMKNANKALLLGLDQSALPKLFENAAIVGRAAGRTVNEAIEDITLGIGRQSRLILDNLGIIIKAEDVYKNYADSVGKTVSQLTEAEKRMAFTTEAMAALQESANKLGGSIQNDILTNIQQLNAEWTNFKDNFGTAFIDVIAPTIGGMKTNFSELGTTVGKVFGAIVSMILIGFQVVKLSLYGVVDLIVYLIQSALQNIENFINTIIDGVNILIKGINAIAKIMGFKSISLIGKLDITSGIDAYRSNGLENINAEYEKLVSMTDAFTKAWEDVGKAQEESTGQIQKQQSAEEALVAQLEGLKVLYRMNYDTGKWEYGDIYDPTGFATSEFNTKFDYEQARLGAGITINIENVNGLDPDEISEALQRKLTQSIGLGN